MSVVKLLTFARCIKVLEIIVVLHAIQLRILAHAVARDSMHGGKVVAMVAQTAQLTVQRRVVDTLSRPLLELFAQCFARYARLGIQDLD